MIINRAWWFEQKRMFAIQISLYVLRVLIKISVGLVVGSALLISDGVHNIGDAGVLISAILVILFMAKKSEGIYEPNNIPVVFQSFIVLLMLGVAYVLAIDLVNHFGVPSSRVLDGSGIGLITTALIASIGISLATSAYQIASWHPPLVAAGIEMRMDAFIESAILTGFLCEYFLSWTWVEPIGTFIVILLIGKTCFEMGKEVWNSILQISIGKEFEADIRKLVLSTYGVRAITKLETYPVLQAVRIKVWVLTECGAEANEDIKRALCERIHDHVLKEYAECRPDVFFALPKTDLHRVAFAVTSEDGREYVARSFSTAQKLRICELASGTIVSAEDTRLPTTHDELIALLTFKHVRIYRSWNEDPDIILRMNKSGVTYSGTPSFMLPSMK